MGFRRALPGYRIAYISIIIEILPGKHERFPEKRGTPKRGENFIQRFLVSGDKLIFFHNKGKRGWTKVNTQGLIDS